MAHVVLQTFYAPLIHAQSNGLCVSRVHYWNLRLYGSNGHPRCHGRGVVSGYDAGMFKYLITALRLRSKSTVSPPPLPCVYDYGRWATGLPE